MNPTLLATLPGLFVTIGGVVVMTIVGTMYLVGLWRKEKDSNTTTGEAATTYVITALKEQIAVLEKKVAQQQVDLSNMALQLATLSGENKNLKELLQGRDAETQKFQGMGLQVMTTIVPDLVKTTNQTNQNVLNLNKVIEKHLTMMEKKQVVTVTTGLVDQK